MIAGKVSIVLLGAGLLLIIEQKRSLLQTASVAPAAQPDLRAGEVFRDRMKNGTNGPEMVVIPAGKFRMGDIQVKAVKMSNPFTRCIFGNVHRLEKCTVRVPGQATWGFVLSGKSNKSFP